MKYIDAEKLIANLERQNVDKKVIEPVIRIIDSLRQEQQERKKKCNDCPHCVDRKDQYGWHFKGCFGGPYKGKFIAEIDECPLEHEQQEVDLEKFTEKMDAWKARYNYPDNIPIKATMAFTARMFYMYPKVAREWYDSLPKVTQD